MQTTLRQVALAWVMIALFLLASCSGASQTYRGDESGPSRMPSKIVSFDTTEGTLMSIDVSPDGTILVFDLLGDLYGLPIDGGWATPLTTGRAWDSAPTYSPDGKFIYFISDREGSRNIWRLTLSDRSLTQVTESESNIDGSLNWSQNATRLLAARSDADYIERILHSIDPDTGDMTPINSPTQPWVDRAAHQVNRRPTQIFSAVQGADRQIYYSQSAFDEELRRLVVRLYTFDPETQTGTAITPLDASYSDYKPQLSHDGSLLAYFRQHQDRRTALRMLNRMSGQDRAIVELSDAEDAAYGASQESRPNYAFTPDDRYLIFWHNGKILRVSLADGSMDIIPFRVKVIREVSERAQPTVQHIDDTGVAKIIRWPSVSRDGQTMAFAAIGYIWVMDLITHQIRRLTASSDFETMPALSPDGKSIAYISFTESEDDYWPGRLVVADVDGGTPRQVLASPNMTFLLPNWSQDSQNIALIREVQTEKGIKAAFGWTPATNAVFHEVASAPRNFFNIAIHARTVGFDDAGEKLLFSFQKPRTATTLTTDAVTILATAALDGSAQRTLATGTAEVVGITPSPDLTSLALTRHDETLWLIPFEAGAESMAVSAFASDARRVSDGGGYYVDWNASDQITFGFGQNFYRYCLGDGEAEALLVNVAFAKPNATQPIAFRGARLITLSGNGGAESLIESGTIVVSGQRIAAVGPIRDVAIPADALIIDVTDKTIIPGLLDVHYHSIGGYGLSALQLPNANFNDRSALAYGVTMAWEPGGASNDGVPANVDLQEAGRIVGPRWSHAAQGRLGRPSEQLTTYADALAVVRRQQALGVNVLKGPAPNRKHQQWLSAAAHQQGLGTVVHIDNFQDMLTGIVDGITGGEHSYIPIPFFKDVNEMLRQSGYIWTPNIVITSGSVSGDDDVSNYFWQQVRKKRPGGLEKLKVMASVSFAERASKAAFGQSQVPYQDHRVSRVAAQIAAVAQSGVHIGVSAHNMPGARLHGEMWYLWKGGMPIEDVLRATTIGNAQKLGLQEEIGSLEVGKIADFLVLDENPLDDILNTLSLKYTVQGGVVYDSNTAERVEVSNFSLEADAGSVH